MTNNGTIFVISDLHLRSPKESLYKETVYLIDHIVQPNDVLLILGDLFDIFIGSKTVFRMRFKVIIDAIENAAQRGTEIYYLEGNHDFHLDRCFKEINHLNIVDGDIVLSGDSKRLYLSHGDRVNDSDYGYKILYFILHNPLSKFLIQLAPGILIDFLGRTFSKISRDYKPFDDQSTKDLYRKNAERLWEQGFHYILMGHTHVKEDYRHDQNQYCNVGFPNIHRVLLTKRPGDPYFQFIEWPKVINSKA